MRRHDQQVPTQAFGIDSGWGGGAPSNDLWQRSQYTQWQVHENTATTHDGHMQDAALRTLANRRGVGDGRLARGPQATGPLPPLISAALPCLGDGRRAAYAGTASGHDKGGREKCRLSNGGPAHIKCQVARSCRRLRMTVRGNFAIYTVGQVRISTGKSKAHGSIVCGSMPSGRALHSARQAWARSAA